MKFLIIIIIIAVAATLVFQHDILTPEPVKIYKAHREKVATAQDYSARTISTAKWSIKIISHDINDTRAEIKAIEYTSKIPPNAASHVFATKTTRELEAVLFQQHGTWELANERVLSESVSTYEDRKKAGEI